MRYPHWVRLSLPHAEGEGSTDPDTGIWSPGPEGTRELYNGPADVQDEGAMVSRRAEVSQEVKDSSATIFFPEPTALEGVTTEVNVEINFGPAPPDDVEAGPWDADAEVVRGPVRLDTKLFVRYL